MKNFVLYLGLMQDSLKEQLDRQGYQAKPGTDIQKKFVGIQRRMDSVSVLYACSDIGDGTADRIRKRIIKALVPLIITKEEFQKKYFPKITGGAISRANKDGSVI